MGSCWRAHGMGAHPHTPGSPGSRCPRWHTQPLASAGRSCCCSKDRCTPAVGELQSAGATSIYHWALETTLLAPDNPGQGHGERGWLGALGLPRAPRTTLRPQSHSSPSSTKWFPQVGLPVRSWGSGMLERHQPWPCCRLCSRSCRLQLLKLKPGVNLQSQEGAHEVGRGLGPSPPEGLPAALTL